MPRQRSQSLLQLASEDPLVALCHHFNVSPVSPDMPANATTLAMPIARSPHITNASHVLALNEPSPDGDPAPRPLMMAPINLDSYRRGFHIDILPDASTTVPVPFLSQNNNMTIIPLPIIPFTVPHLPSLPLLLLFALNLETDLNLLACRLLPAAVIGEFPHAAAMSQSMARLCTDDQYRRYYFYTQGLWKNILALGPRDTRIVELVQTVWNVTTDARKIRQRERTTSGVSVASRPRTSESVPTPPRQRTDSSTRR